MIPQTKTVPKEQTHECLVFARVPLKGRQRVSRAPEARAKKIEIFRYIGAVKSQKPALRSLKYAFGCCSKQELFAGLDPSTHYCSRNNVVLTWSCCTNLTHPTIVGATYFVRLLYENKQILLSYLYTCFSAAILVLLSNCSHRSTVIGAIISVN